MEQALALIAEVKRIKATRLDIGNCGLITLRDWLLPLLMNGQVTVAGEVESLEKKGEA